ncbi:MAG TPA: PfkB family carbohydrate kinase [Acidimicrobiia bacterium]|nr:PfkB family carbohydrate kinase [Acidimicrobiia bacterium]
MLGTPDPKAVVLAPGVLFTVTIEPLEDGDDDTSEIHLHPGGQGFWIARMLRLLGVPAVLCGPAGGEPGRAMRALIGDWEIDFQAVIIEQDTAARIHDRRSGSRTEVVQTPPPILDRHEVDDLYGKMLELSLATRMSVVTGRLPGNGIGEEIFTRLGADLAAAGVRTVADLHGRDLDAWLDGGPIDLLKVSDEDLTIDGTLASEAENDVICAMTRLRDRGVHAVVVSRGGRPSLAGIGGILYRVHPPSLSVVDETGAGDSMTGALAAAFLANYASDDMLRLGCAAGSANVTRKGLATGSAHLIHQLVYEVTVEEVGTF